MKINEVETCVGITKKNIRFYEGEGLLNPQRNSVNGYREYGETEIQVLMQIKLLRKIGFPLEEIRKMQRGTLTVSDGMDRHRVILERESKNIVQSINLCEKLASSATRLEELDAKSILNEMETLENYGANFQNKYEKDRKVNILSAIIVAVIVVLLVLTGNILAIWGMFVSNEISVTLIAVLIFLSAVIILSVISVLFARLKEISDGEIEQAKRY